MEFKLEDWLSNTGRANDVLQTIYEVVEFSKGKYTPFFQNCGLYACGSSLTQENPSDIDLVLVGLDFRAIAEYDKVFLQDPKTLIEKEIVIPPKLARQRGVVNPMTFTIGEDGMKSAWHPLPRAPGDREEPYDPNEPKKLRDNQPIKGELVEPDKLEDLDDIHQSMLAGIEHEGQYWAYNFQLGIAGSTALSLDNYCLRQGACTDLVHDFHKAVASKVDKYDSWDLIDFFEPYFHNEEYFLTCRFPIHEIGCRFTYGSNGKPCTCRPLDVIIHSENMHVKHWKDYQRTINYPFAAVHEWPQAGEITKRPVITELPQPEFIDSKGVERVKPHPYFFEYLREPPINVDCNEKKYN